MAIRWQTIFLAGLLILTLEGQASERVVEAFETSLEKSLVPTGVSERQDRERLTECFLYKDNGIGIGFYRFFEPGHSVVTRLDPAECDDGPYPYAVTAFHFTLVQFTDSQWPVELNLVLYDIQADSLGCERPGNELLRQLVVVDSLQFGFPFLGSVTLPEPICVEGAFFAGLEYAGLDSIQYPSIVFDTNTVADSCDNWAWKDSLWVEFSDYWGNKPGYPIIRIEGETVAQICCLDPDEDSVCASTDNCLDLANSDQSDADSDLVGDLCDNCPEVGNADQVDSDNDTYGDACDNCLAVANPDQSDSDSDGLGDACDNCPDEANPNQADSDFDGLGDLCDNCPADAENDLDGDGICAEFDNCPCVANPGQLDSDSDGIGDLCENCCTGLSGDVDGSFDGVRNLSDITRLIDRVYISKRHLCCEEAGNTDGDPLGSLNLGDITRLIDHVYVSKDDTAPCS